MGPDAMIFIFWMLSFKPTFLLSSFTFIKRPFSSSSLSAIRVVLSAYLRLLIFLPAILIPACVSQLPYGLCHRWLGCFCIIRCRLTVPCLMFIHCVCCVIWGFVFCVSVWSMSLLPHLGLFCCLECEEVSRCSFYVVLPLSVYRDHSATSKAFLPSLAVHLGLKPLWLNKVDVV